VRTTLKGEMARWISLAPKVDSDWSQSLQTLEGHSGAVWAVAFSPHSALIASASGDRTARVWRADTGECVQTLEGHSGAVLSVAFSHDSDDSALIASASDDRTVRVWRADTGECVQTLEGHSDGVTSVAFSHDSDNSALIASASDDRTVRVWRADTGECIQDTNIGVTSYRLSFETGNKYLLTDAGAIAIRTMVAICPSINIQSYATPPCHSGFGISQDRCWVIWNEEKLFWLPKECRPSCSAISASTVILGCDSGRVIVIRFSSYELLEALRDT
jgi:WD40 repeat protein